MSEIVRDTRPTLRPFWLQHPVRFLYIPTFLIIFYFFVISCFFSLFHKFTFKIQALNSSPHILVPLPLLLACYITLTVYLAVYLQLVLLNSYFSSLIPSIYQVIPVQYTFRFKCLCCALCIYNRILFTCILIVLCTIRFCQHTLCLSHGRCFSTKNVIPASTVQYNSLKGPSLAVL